MSTTDRIEKSIVLKAPVARVWQALTDAHEFGTWFRVKLESAFVEGRRVAGQITHPGYEHVRFDVLVERIEPQRYFAYRWHPYAVDPKVDYSKEPTTRVEFTLESLGAGTRLVVVESGFDRIPAHRRDEALRMNSEGWAGQLRNVQRHVDG